MIKLPAREDGRWTVQYANEKLPDIVTTRNLNFDKEGYLRLSHPTASFYSDQDDADFGVPLHYGVVQSGGSYRVWTNNTAFHFSMTWDSITGAGTSSNKYGGRLTVTQDTTTNVPSSTRQTDEDGITAFGELHVTDADSIVSVSTTSWSETWTDRVTGLGADMHPLCYDLKNNEIVVGDGNEAKSYDSSYALQRTLTLPSDMDIKSLAYNNGYIAVGCHDDENSGNGVLYIWDNQTAAANYAYPIGSSTIHTIAPYRGSFLAFTTLGEVLYWTPVELVRVGSLPSFYDTTAVLSIGAFGTARSCSSWLQSGVAYFNVGSNNGSALAKDGQKYLANQNAGIYAYDESVGLYHRHATTATKTVVDVVATTDVDTATNEITVTAAEDTGTPVRYYSADSATAIAGLDDDALYYTIKVDATTIQLAASYQDAIDGTEIDLTGTGNNNQVLQFYPKSDFGQSYTPTSLQGCVQIDERPITVDGGVYHDGLLYGAVVQHKDTTTNYECGGYVLPDTENRGYFVTSKMMSAGLQEDWQKLFIKHSKLETALDKIVVKYRTLVEDPIVKVKYIDANRTLGGAITWSDSDTFTTTDTQFANVQAGDEVEVVQGAGSGYLLHIDSISEAGGTYTVNLREAVKNISASDTARAVVSRWNYQTTLDSDTITNEDGYSEVALGNNGVKSKAIQFKIELRGEDVEIEELLVAHVLHKPVA